MFSNTVGPTKGEAVYPPHPNPEFQNWNHHLRNPTLPAYIGVYFRPCTRDTIGAKSFVLNELPAIRKIFGFGFGSAATASVYAATSGTVVNLVSSPRYENTRCGGTCRL